MLFDLYIIMKTVVGVFRHNDIYENKQDDGLSDEESAELANEEVIRMAHEGA